MNTNTVYFDDDMDNAVADDTALPMDEEEVLDDEEELDEEWDDEEDDWEDEEDVAPLDDADSDGDALPGNDDLEMDPNGTSGYGE